MATEDSEQPAWVVPFLHEVRELVGLATMSVVDTECPIGTRQACGGMVSAAGWVHGLLFGPITERDEYPVTAAAAEAELVTAGSLVHGSDPDTIRRYCASLGEPYVPPVPNGQGRDYAMGVWWTLRWLLGQEHRPPILVPLRHPNGKLVSADQLYRSMLLDEPEATVARRAELRRHAVEMADESAALATALHNYTVRSGVRS